jgi:multiple sugar transport system substrate-binding protein
MTTFDDRRGSRLSRRTLLRAAGAGLGAAALAPAPTWLGRRTAGAQSYAFPATGKPYAGTELNVAMVAAPKPLALKELLPEFEAATGIKVNFDDLAYTTLQEKQLTAITQGSGTYDVVHVDCVWMGQYAGQGWLTPLDDLVAKTDPAALDVKDFVPKLLDEISMWDGKLYGLPFDTSIMMFYYRTDLLQKYGLDVPQTWDDVQQAAAKITDAEKANDVYGLTLMAKRGVQLDCTYDCLLGANGGAYYDDNYKATLNSPQAVAVLEALVKLVGVANPGSLAQDYDEGDATFSGGKPLLG